MSTKRAVARRKAEEASYETSRFNAVKHGVLSKHTVLPWEDQGEYDTLHAALVQDHRPIGPTEEHLVEELAGIFWRKRRLRLGEAATIQRGLKDAIKHLSLFPFGVSSVIATLMYASEPELTQDNTLIFTDIVCGNPKNVAEEVRQLRPVVEAIEEALILLGGRESSSYNRALENLDPLIRASWQVLVEKSARRHNQKYTATADSLLDWIKFEAYPYFQRRLAALNNIDALREQAFGDSFRPERLESLARYETHLDRKFERTVGMLVKLQEIRRQRDSEGPPSGEIQ